MWTDLIFTHTLTHTLTHAHTVSLWRTLNTPSQAHTEQSQKLVMHKVTKRQFHEIEILLSKISAHNTIKLEIIDKMKKTKMHFPLDIFLKTYLIVLWKFPLWCSRNESN